MNESIRFDDVENEYIQEAWSVNTLIGTLYFLKRFKNICVSNITELKWFCKEGQIGKCTRYLMIPNDFVERIQLCEDDPSKRFILSFLTLYDQKSTGENKDGHQNVLIIDLQDRSVELFEPHGEASEIHFDQKELIVKLKKLFNDLGFPTFYETTDYCPKLSFQTLQELERAHTADDPLGFCQTWSIWWVYYRLKNADFTGTRKELTEKALKEINTHPQALTTLIRQYAKFIAKERTRLIQEINETNPKEAKRWIDELQKPSSTINKLLLDYIIKQIVKAVEKVTPTYHSAREIPIPQDIKYRDCRTMPCPADKMCRTSTGNCVIRKAANEEITIVNGKKYLVTKTKIIPTVNNFKEVYIREYIYNKCSERLTKDELYMVLFYEGKPINGAEKIWKNINDL